MDGGRASFMATFSEGIDGMDLEEVRQLAELFVGNYYDLEQKNSIGEKQITALTDEVEFLTDKLNSLNMAAPIPVPLLEHDILQLHQHQEHHDGTQEPAAQQPLVLDFLVPPQQTLQQLQQSLPVPLVTEKGDADAAGAAAEVRAKAEEEEEEEEEEEAAASAAAAASNAEEEAQARLKAEDGATADVKAAAEVAEAAASVVKVRLFFLPWVCTRLQAALSLPKS